MSTYPTSPRADFHQWCQSHQQVFVDHAAASGLTTEQAADFATDTTAAVAADLAQASSKEAAKVATQTVNDAVDTLRFSAGDVVRSIRAYAELQTDPNGVYNTAQIPPPASPTPTPPPGRPTCLAATLDATDGSLTLTWKARMPRRRGGATYLVRRQLPGEDGFTILGTTGKKTFVDDSLLAGMASVRYTVQAQRGESVGDRHWIVGLPLDLNTECLVAARRTIRPFGGTVQTIPNAWGRSVTRRRKNFGPGMYLRSYRLLALD